jgi:DNA modification methylase
MLPVGQVLVGDMRLVLADWDECSVDAIVCDPPYELGFMGKAWDRSGVAFDPVTWAAALRVLRPGGHMLAFGGTRTYHRMVCAIEDAGFEIRDMLDWIYGQGFPKSHDIGRAIDMEVCGLPGRHYDKNLPKGDKARPGDHLCPVDSRGDPHRGEGTALKPGQEPICLARKPIIGSVAQNTLAHGTGGINVDRCRIGRIEGDRTEYGRDNTLNMTASAALGGYHNNAPYQPHDAGRWPANVILDEVAAAMIDEQSGLTTDGVAVQRNRDGRDKDSVALGKIRNSRADDCGYGQSGGASRFFYTAKATKAEREAGLDEGSGQQRHGRHNHHPTVKPISLMRWLVRLVTPPKGIVVDPFCGSGTTLAAAEAEGFRWIGIDLEEQHAAIARARVVASAEQAGTLDPQAARTATRKGAVQVGLFGAGDKEE